VTRAQKDVLRQLKKNVRMDYMRACERWQDPYEAVAAMDVDDEALRRVIARCDAGPFAWMNVMPLNVKRTLRRLGMIVY